MFTLFNVLTLANSNFVPKFFSKMGNTIIWCTHILRQNTSQRRLKFWMKYWKAIQMRILVHILVHNSQIIRIPILVNPCQQWSGRLDSNQRPLEPHSSALSQAALRPENEDLYNMSLNESYIRMYKIWYMPAHYIRPLPIFKSFRTAILLSTTLCVKA